MDKFERQKIVNKISIITIIANVFLSFIKIIVGIVGRSNALVADGFHSLSDVFSTVVVMIGVKLAEKEDDETHPYGHEKIEPVIGKILSNILLLTAVYMGYKGIKSIFIRDYYIPEKMTIFAAVFSILVKEWMFRYTIRGAKKVESSALMADAWHHRSDALSSIGSLIGITGAVFGYPILDPIASVIISIFICKVAIEIYIQSVRALIDSAADKETIKNIKKIILGINGVIQIDELKTRIHANKLYVDVEIAVDRNLSVSEAHKIAEDVHDSIENEIKKVKHCMVHVNPFGE
ncbi:cation diffusion facilitator family transporter [Caminicella sporogenes DSM 14501]|uniref:Cation diffusion facilitator family transporter n=1 Tax=Caminicella sporogenes DSM 14501 TaxID=1121266 RepID=A0A1M6TX89_9FIRM|nr:cation diffusion facilitator family transporter [Caminicella sporogenes]RKD21515.1 cation diffusion facilitator family transporter [Caminicella sporogenes]SHK61531.1 cation diffusion facilitator family transporter [Caminicella sporogenes DSM 14501]